MNDSTLLAAKLRSRGLRVTAIRLAVLKILESNPHADTETVIQKVTNELGSASMQAVYNVLSAFIQVGLVRRIEPAGSVGLYELRVGDNHHHVVCRKCAVVQDIDCVVGKRPCLTPSETKGFVLDEAEVTFWGLCPECQKEQKVKPKTPRGVMTKESSSKKSKKNNS